MASIRHLEADVRSREGERGIFVGKQAANHSFVA